MLIVDAQIHLWAGAGSSPRHGSRPFLVSDALAGMDAAGVTAAVVHPPEWDPAARRYAANAVAAHPDRFAAYTTLALDRPTTSLRLALGDHVHRAPAVAARGRPRTGDGQGIRRLARLDAGWP
jgi:predicted TIM-barrel fold metal-dependent hydrolase